MPKKNTIKYDELHSSTLFAGVSPRVLKKIALLPFIREHVSNYTIIKKDDIGDFLIIILSGEVDVIDDSNEKEEFEKYKMKDDYYNKSDNPKKIKLVSALLKKVKLFPKFFQNRLH
jgi:hypothetical protein